LMGERMGAYMS